MKKVNINVSPVSTIFLFLLCLACISPSVYGQINRSTISGFVFDLQRRPVTQIPVELMNEVNSIVARTKTDGSGRFFFSGLSGGRFQVKVLPFGTDFQEQTKEVELVTMGALGRPMSDMAYVDIFLRPRKSNSTAVNGVLFAQEIPADAKKIYEKATSDLDNKKTDLGVEGLKNALKIFPTYYLALEKLGLIYVNQQKYEDARDLFIKAVEVNSRSFNSWYGLSYASYALKQSTAAVESAQKAVSLNADSLDAQLFLGLSLRQAKRYQEAEKSLKQAAKIGNGKSPEVHWNLALLYAHNLNRYRDAADQLELYLKANTDAPNAENIKKLIKQFREKSISSN